MKTIYLTVIAVLLLVSTPSIADTFTFSDRDVIFEGDNLIALDGTAVYPVITQESSYSLRRKHSSLTKCYDDENRPIGCEMLFAVGYADHVSVTISNGAVSSISVIEIHL